MIKVILQERISERIVEQIVDVSGSESLAATLVSEVASKNSCAHVTADHEVSANTSAEELMAEATQVLQSKTCGADGQMHSLFQENKCCLPDIDRSQRIRYGDSGKTAR